VATVLVISLSDLTSDPRVDRQIEFLRGTHRVIAAGLGPPAYDDVDYVALDPPPGSGLARRMRRGIAAALRLARLDERGYWAEPDHRHWRRLLTGLGQELTLVNDATLLPLAFSLPGGKPVVFDAHEYAPVEFETSRMWRLFYQAHMRWICRAYLPRASSMMAVSEGIAARYEDLEPTAVSEPVRLVHFGWPDPQRRLDYTIEALNLLGDGYSLDLLLMTPPHLQDQLRELRELAAGNPRIRFLDPVPMRELVRSANPYDIGVHMLPPATFNQRFALPNKLFEFIQARIAPAIGPSPEMARIVRQWDCGIVAEDYTPEALAAAVGDASRERLAEMKRNAGRAAREHCAERNRDRVLGVVDGALRQGVSGVAPVQA
jgi:glycosyltransferase involved in cell wall biosynthesis